MTIIRFPTKLKEAPRKAPPDVLKEAAECRQWADIVKLAHYIEAGGPNVHFRVQARAVECTYRKDGRAIRLDILYMSNATAQLLLDMAPAEQVTLPDA